MMQLKSSYKSFSTRHLYEFEEEIGNIGDSDEIKLSAETEKNADTASTAGSTRGWV